jgi:anaerobic magnesium-protoporphyrin IX monomethyl ester cyclase
MPTRTIALVMMPPVYPKMPPLGLGYLQAYVEAHGMSADIIDVNNAWYRCVSEGLKKEWLRSSNIHFENTLGGRIKREYGREYSFVHERLAAYGVIGFSCFKSNLQTTCDFISDLRQRHKQVKIVLGGPEITRQSLKHKGRIPVFLRRVADFFVVGEGERAFLEYLEGREDSSRVIAYRQLRSLKSIPFPRYRGITMCSYPHHNAIALLASRGCVRYCAFCSERLLHKGFCTRSVEGIIDEIHYHRQTNQISSFVFYDSLLNGDIRFLEQLCDALIRSFGGVNWEAQIAVRTDMPQRLFDKMKKSGCYNLFVGLESGSDRTLERMRKGFASAQAEAFFKQLHASGLSFGISIIVGFPRETEADFRQTLDFIIKHKDLIPKIEQVNPYVYYDGTPVEPRADYRMNKRALERFNSFISAMKSQRIRYTNAFVGNLIDKDGHL